MIPGVRRMEGSNMRAILALLAMAGAASAAETPMLAVSLRGDNAVKLYDIQFTGMFGEIGRAHV